MSASGRVRLENVGNSDRETLEDAVDRTTPEGAMVDTDEWKGYGRSPEMSRGPATVSHAERRRARHDGYGCARCMTNTLEVTWTGLRNFLRT